MRAVTSLLCMYHVETFKAIGVSSEIRINLPLVPDHHTVMKIQNLIYNAENNLTLLLNL